MIQSKHIFTLLKLCFLACLLNSCSPKISIPFSISDSNHFMFDALLNDQDSVRLYFDTGGSDLVFTFDGIENKTSLLDTNPNYKRENYEMLENLNSLKIGDLSWDSLSLYPVQIGPTNAAGHFGWNLFEGKIIELNFEKNKLYVYQDLKKNLERHTKLDLEIINTFICVDGRILSSDDSYKGKYLLDSGFQGTLILDKDIRKKQNFPENLTVIKENKLRNSAGDEFINAVVLIDEFCLGSTCVSDIPVQLISTPNPARFETHLLGNEIMRRYNTIFDFKNMVMYIKPNKFINSPYPDLAG